MYLYITYLPAKQLLLKSYFVIYGSYRDKDLIPEESILMYTNCGNELGNFTWCDF